MRMGGWLGWLAYPRSESELGILRALAVHHEMDWTWVGLHGNGTAWVGIDGGAAVKSGLTKAYEDGSTVRKSCAATSCHCLQLTVSSWTWRHPRSQCAFCFVFVLDIIPGRSIKELKHLRNYFQHDPNSYLDLLRRPIQVMIAEKVEKGWKCTSGNARGNGWLH